MRALMTIDEAADFLRISRRQVYNLIDRRELPVVRVGSRIRIDIERWLAERRT